MLRHTKLPAEQRLRCRGPQANHYFGFQDANFRVQPRTTGGNLGCIRFFVDAALSTRLPFKVFYSISNINLRSVNSCFHQSFVQQSAGRPHKGLTLEIFLIAGLFAHKDNFGLPFPFTKNGLRPALPQVASLAFLRCLLQRRKGRVWRNQTVGRCLALGHAFMMLPSGLIYLTPLAKLSSIWLRGMTSEPK